MIFNFFPGLKWDVSKMTPFQKPVQLLAKGTPVWIIVSGRKRVPAVVLNDNGHSCFVEKSMECEARFKRIGMHKSHLSLRDTSEKPTSLSKPTLFF